jgi:uncharacterized protein YbaR (Trm112 family)
MTRPPASRCPHRGRHWFTIHGSVGLRSPVCTDCGAPNPRPLSQEEWEELAGWQQMTGRTFRGHVGAALTLRDRQLAYAGWSHFDGNMICGRCNKWIPCDDDLPSILAAPAGHDCYQDPGAGWYLKPPEVPAAGRYWQEPDGILTPLTDGRLTPDPG